MFSTDENECQRIVNPCLDNAQCINTPGSYQCGCADGYRLLPDGHRCQGEVQFLFKSV